ncbi:hypothetical protein D3C86_2061910 [compost metagenome]
MLDTLACISPDRLSKASSVWPTANVAAYWRNALSAPRLSRAPATARWLGVLAPVGKVRVCSKPSFTSVAL